MSSIIVLLNTGERFSSRHAHARHAPEPERALVRDFEPPKGLSRKAWEEERNQRLTKPGDIEVNLENLKVVSVSGDRATVKLRQHYRSANLSTSSNKTLNLMLQDGKWVIVQERVGG